MRRLETLQLEEVVGGGWGSCVSGGIGLLTLGIGVAFTPVTGGLSAWLVVGALGGGATTGWSLGECVQYIAHGE